MKASKKFCYKLLFLGTSDSTVKEGVAAVNRCLSCEVPGNTLLALKLLGDNIPSLLDFAAPLYHEEMAAIRQDAQASVHFAASSVCT